MKNNLFIVSFLFLLLSLPTFAEVYKWVDSEGVVHYSSEKEMPDAEPADLPRINRGELKLGHLKLVSCDSHGGIDCQSGPDEDGSVICLDGFKESSAIYRFTCNSPKLKIANISKLDESGLFTVNIRNSKSVLAKNTTVYVELPEKGEVELSGPKEIDAYGAGEFKLAEQYTAILTLQPTIADIRVDCANCP